jgi:hypothetical protein
MAHSLVFPRRSILIPSPAVILTPLRRVLRDGALAMLNPAMNSRILGGASRAGVAAFDGGGGGFAPGGVVFNGSSYMARGASMGGADTKFGTCSFWVWMKGGNSAGQTICFNSVSGANRLAITRTSGNNINLFARDSAGATVLNMSTTGVSFTTSDTAYRHVILSWDLNAGTGKIYVDGVDRTTGGPGAGNAVDYTGNDFFIGHNGSGGAILNAWLAEFYLDLATAVDITSSTELEKFRSSGGSPVDLGTTGTNPTGLQPRHLLRAPAASFTTNSGSGGNFTVTAGSLSDAATGPP